MKNHRRDYLDAEIPASIKTTEWVVRSLERLVHTGRFGKTPGDVAEELLRAKLRELEREGWLK